MRQPSEPERAPIQEGITQHTVIVGRNNDLHSFVANFRMEWLLIFHFLKER